MTGWIDDEESRCIFGFRNKVKLLLAHGKRMAGASTENGGYTDHAFWHLFMPIAPGANGNQLVLVARTAGLVTVRTARRQPKQFWEPVAVGFNQGSS